LPATQLFNRTWQARVPPTFANPSLTLCGRNFRKLYPPLGSYHQNSYPLFALCTVFGPLGTHTALTAGFSVATKNSPVFHQYLSQLVKIARSMPTGMSNSPLFAIALKPPALKLSVL